MLNLQSKAVTLWGNGDEYTFSSICGFVRSTENNTRSLHSECLFSPIQKPLSKNGPTWCSGGSELKFIVINDEEKIFNDQSKLVWFKCLL